MIKNKYIFGNFTQYCKSVALYFSNTNSFTMLTLPLLNLKALYLPYYSFRSQGYKKDIM